MKRMIRALSVLAVAVVFTGCYKNVPQEAAAPVEVREVALDIAPPSQEETDLVVIAHVKKRLTEDPYTFTVKVDGREIKETVQGVKETESNILAERGEGTNYALAKRFRVKPGSYKISLATEDGQALTKRELAGGHVYTVIFDPVYGPAKFARPKDFREGVIDFNANFEVGNHLKE
ncbi:hypothetical protein ANRL1_03052 [Anaerolineae bacterium]|nr:hypothetical protein ANRL1_03052 [Anaerolineae bacterium]